MKQITQFICIFFFLFVIPFVFIWVAFFLSGFAFSPKEVFGGPTFWGLSIMYWICAFVATGAITDEDSKTKRRYKSGSF